MKALVIVVVLVVFSPNVLAQHDPPQAAREEVNLGVKAYKQADYDAALQHFQRAVSIDGDFSVARLYLATTFAQQYVPGVDTDENRALAEKAIEQYQELLKRQPDSMHSLKGIAYLKMQMKQFDDARLYYRWALKLDDKDPELYYSVAVIDWTEAYRNTAVQKTRLRLKTGDLLIQNPSCPKLRARNLPLVEEGLDMLTQAVRLRKDYDDAMVYISLLYRQRAEIACGDQAATQADQKRADQWTELAMEARKKKIESGKKCAGGLVLEKECQQPPP
ncbi:MAG TPA: tetratricopeptide repeat protein [Candidatus Angelobacter sp.]